MEQDKVRQVLNLFFAIAQPVVALLVNLEITGPGIGRVSDRYPNHVVPAGYAFGVWNLIFALSLGYGIWQALPEQHENALLRRVGWLTALVPAATSAWMLAFQHSLFLMSLAVMFGLLILLIVVIVRLYRHPRTLSRGEYLLVYVNFSIFMGWITVATVANVGQVLTAYEWDGWGLPAETWGVLALLSAGAIAAFVTALTGGNLPFALTVIWGLSAVAVTHFTRAVPTNSTMVGAAAVGLSLLVGVTLLMSRNRRGAGRFSKADASLRA